MQNMNERPICHRGEDLVSYLYGEANETESRDFAEHMRLCDACRSEFVIFRQVHESVLEWRNEALGAVSAPQVAAAQADSGPATRTPVRLPAIAAIREFFKVSPLWLRGATAVATVLFCLLAVLAVARLGRRPAEVAGSQNSEGKLSDRQLEELVAKRVNERVDAIKREQALAQQSENNSDKKAQAPVAVRQRNSTRPQLAKARLTRQEREQLLADLGLTPGYDDEEMPFVLPDEPNQDKDN